MTYALYKDVSNNSRVLEFQTFTKKLLNQKPFIWFINELFHFQYYYSFTHEGSSGTQKIKIGEVVFLAVDIGHGHI